MSIAKAILASAWMGWQRQMGWSKPILTFALRTVPLTAAVLSASLVYWFGSSSAGSFMPERLAFILVGASLYAHIASFVWVPTSAIAEGKWTEIFAKVYITPTSSVPYLAGRCLAAFAASIPPSAISLVASYFVCNALFGTAIPMAFSVWSIPLMFFALIANLPAAIGLGYLLCSPTIFVTKFEWVLPSYISGILMIFSEALFPASTLPWPLSLISELLPFTHVMRASRALLLTMSLESYATALAYNILGGVVILAIGIFAFRFAERRARRNGVIDRKVG